MKKSVVIGLFFLFGCSRVSVDPEPIFNEIQCDVMNRTHQTVCWGKETIDELLQEELTPELAVTVALLNNSELRATYSRLGIAQANVYQAALLKNPIFAAAYKFSTTSSVTALIDVALLQNFLEVLLIPLKKQMAADELEVTKAFVTTKILQMIEQTRIAFYSFQAKQQIWDLKQKVLLGAEASYEAARRLVAAGNLRELDCITKRLFYEQTKVEVASLEIEVLRARERLNVLMGLFGRQIEWKSCADLPVVPEMKMDWNDLENRAIANSLDLRIVRKQLHATAAGYGIEATRLVFPEIDIGPIGERESDIWYVGPGFSFPLPIFDYGRGISAAAHAELSRQSRHYTALAIEIRAAARLARLKVLNAFRQTRYQQEVIVPLAEKMTHLTLLQHNAMQLGLFTLLGVKLEEMEKKITAVEALRDYWIERSRFELLLNGHMEKREWLDLFF
ncbi:MAG: hypothetical protein S4CHLAM45_04130 [Chlamydiales bacterium]|nr:hypothetical protein [Chlamydiales bacterium]MCH9619267.1 hypothetical protein [Chlamydiales bacterium]MCH9622529.1 hypothetical protein [Chlamydiales bacterium]